MTGYTLELWRFDPKFNTKKEEKAEPIKVSKPVKIDKTAEFNKPVELIQSLQLTSAAKPIMAKPQPIVEPIVVKPQFNIEVLAALSYLNTKEAIIKYNGNVYLWKDGRTDVETLVAMEITEKLKNYNFIKINSFK